MKRHLNRKKIDPEHVGFWKRLFASPFVVLLEREPGQVPSDYFGGQGVSVTAGLINMTRGHGNACILQKQEVKQRTITLLRNSDMITAFYFPLIPGLRLVRLEIGGQPDAEWTPEGSEFRQPPLPLSAILDECRSLPTSFMEIPWERILEGSRSQADYPIIHHDFGRTIEIDGETYRRAVLVHPCIALLGLQYHDVRLTFEFASDAEQEVVYYQESWILEHEFRRYIAQDRGDFSIDSDTFADQSNEGRMWCGIFGLKFSKKPEISDLGRLLQAETDTRHAITNLGTLRDSAFKI